MLSTMLPKRAYLVIVLIPGCLAFDENTREFQDRLKRNEYDNTREFQDRLERNGIQESTIRILKENGVTSLNILRSFNEDDIAKLGLPLGQYALLREFVKQLRNEGSQRTKQYHKGHDADDTFSYKRGSKEKDADQMLEDMDENQFWCLFKCLGGIGAVGLAGLVALAGLVTVALPAIGFGAAGIAAGSLAASIMSLYGGAVGAGSVFAVLQSVAAAGIGWKAILLTMFGSSTVYAAIQGACAHCF